MDDVEAKISVALEAMAQKAQTEKWGESRWTSGVKQAIVDVGREFGWFATASRCESDDREWLYDVTWYRNDDAHNLTDVPLVAESEFSAAPKDIKYDFEKLLVARSKYKIMVFQARSEDEVSQLFMKMRLWVSAFHETVSGDRYMLIGWASGRWLFDFYMA